MQGIVKKNGGGNIEVLLDASKGIDKISDYTQFGSGTITKNIDGSYSFGTNQWSSGIYLIPNKKYIGKSVIAIGTRTSNNAIQSVMLTNNKTIKSEVKYQGNDDGVFLKNISYSYFGIGCYSSNDNWATAKFTKIYVIND